MSREGAHAAPGDVYQLWKKHVIGSGKPFVPINPNQGGGNDYYFERAVFKVAHGDKKLTVKAEVFPDMGGGDMFFWGVEWPAVYGAPSFRVGAKVTGRAAAKAAAQACVSGGIDAAREQMRGPAISDDIPE